MRPGRAAGTALFRRTAAPRVRRGYNVKDLQIVQKFHISREEGPMVVRGKRFGGASPRDVARYSSESQRAMSTILIPSWSYSSCFVRAMTIFG